MLDVSPGKKGALLAITGSILWGIMGVTCQYLVQNKGLPPIWVVTVRMFFAGLVLLGADYFIYKKNFFAPWKGMKNIIQMLIFSFITITWVQYVYLSAVRHMNAAMATVFVSLAPIATILWMSLRSKSMPKFYEIICCISAVTGAVVMATHGDMTTLSVSETGIIYGIMLPIFGVIYTVQPGYLMKRFRPSNVTGWGLLLAGTVSVANSSALDHSCNGGNGCIYHIKCGVHCSFWYGNSLLDISGQFEVYKAADCSHI